MTPTTIMPALRGLLLRQTGKLFYLTPIERQNTALSEDDDLLHEDVEVLLLDDRDLAYLEEGDHEALQTLFDTLPDIIDTGDAGSFLVAESKERLAELLAEPSGNKADPTAWPRLLGKVAIVTGSAQGFGEGIAEELARVGASVVIADLNEELAQKVAARLNETYGAFTALAVKVNVGDEASVEHLIEQTVLQFGGLDIYINNAGVLRAGGLEEMDVDSFEFVTKINYTAYFIGTKYAARPMRIQNRFAGGVWTDIIQINSKSGLDGSNRNFAYAGGKFGGIGLTQSFAKELVDDRIKVNAICPGNFYEGPLWSDPEKGLFVQYLNAGKVAGAKTVDDVYRHYVSMVPMRKGCSPLDVARAVFYVVEQENETGQAIPVTGGQVMLN